MPTRRYTAILEKEDDLYVALCPELDVASQGATVKEATANLKEAVELFLEAADLQEIKRRLRGDMCPITTSCRYYSRCQTTAHR